MEMFSPLVSAIVPTKNSANTLARCLESLKNQTYKDLEIIVVDNHSTDGTDIIARAYTSFVWTVGPERSAQRNYGVQQAKGKFVCIIDSDMVLDANVIQDCVSAINSDVHHKGVIIPEESFGEGFWAQCKKLERSFYVGVSYIEAARFFGREDFMNVGGYNTKMVSGEDWDLSQRIETLGSLARVQSYIYHDEGRLSLLRTVRKKFYYAQVFSAYADATTSTNIQKQVTPLGRYWLFFREPRRLFANPFVGTGMLFMKTCEFFWGSLGYIWGRLRKGKH